MYAVKCAAISMLCCSRGGFFVAITFLFCLSQLFELKSNWKIYNSPTKISFVSLVPVLFKYDVLNCRATRTEKFLKKKKKFLIRNDVYITQYWQKIIFSSSIKLSSIVPPEFSTRMCLFLLKNNIDDKEASSLWASPLSSRLFLHWSRLHVPIYKLFSGELVV